MNTVFVVYFTSDFSEEPVISTAVYRSLNQAYCAAVAMVFAEQEPERLNFYLDHDELVANHAFLNKTGQDEIVTVRIREVVVRD